MKKKHTTVNCNNLNDVVVYVKKEKGSKSWYYSFRNNNTYPCHSDLSFASLLVYWYHGDYVNNIYLIKSGEQRKLTEEELINGKLYKYIQKSRKILRYLEENDYEYSDIHIFL